MRLSKHLKPSNQISPALKDLIAMTNNYIEETVIDDNQLYPFIDFDKMTDLFAEVEQDCVIAYTVATDKDVLFLVRSSASNSQTDRLEINHYTLSGEGEWWEVNRVKRSYCAQLRDISKMHTEMNTQANQIARAYRSEMSKQAKKAGYKGIAYPTH